jgi:hypothetical protein
MAEHFIKCEFFYNSVIGLQIGDYITYNSENYYINRLPSIVKINNNSFQYSIVFESVLYNLSRKLFISSDGLADYSYNGSATDFITNIVASINEIDSGWTVGTVDTSDDLTLYFTNESCRAALTRVAEAFKMEFSLSGKAISLVNSVGSTTSLRFEYGRDLGLYKLERQQVSDQNIITKVFGFGSTRNLPYTYRSGVKRLTFAGAAASGYLVSASSGLYGVIEGQFTDDNIFPQRTGTLTGVGYTTASGWSNTDYLEDSAMDFDINSYLIEGQIATIVFKSGDMSGVECEIWKYENATKKFFITPFTDSTGYVQPNTLNHPHVGDSYTIVNIAMPQSYIDTAETALKVATQAYLDENSIPMVVYSVDIDPKYVQSKGISLNVGDKVTVVDTDLGISSLIRVSAIEFPLVNSSQIKAVIADFVPYTLQERIVKASISNRKETVFVDRRQAELARRNTVNQKSLKDLLFDTDLYFDPTNLKPLSIETAYLAVGTKSRDFWLSGVTIKANYLGDANAINVSAGSLVHLQIEITGLGYTWVIGSALNQSSLTPSTAYYLYARCSKSALTGNWVLSSSQITFEQETGYYHFLIGLLFAVADGYRDFDFTYGMTYINGGVITTGKIQSIDTNNFFDLTNNKFHVGDANSYLDWNNLISSSLNVKGSFIISSATGYSNLSDKPTSLSGINSSEGSKLTSVASGATVGATWGVNIDGSNKPADNATVGATWGTNLNSVPSRLAETAPDNSLAFTDDFLGFHASGINWPIKISNVSGVGKFYAGNGGDTYMDWNGTILAIHGVLSGIDSDIATVAVPAGDLDGTTVNTTTNLLDIYTVTFSGTGGTCDIECNGTTKLATFNGTAAQTAADFVSLWAASFPGITLGYTAGDTYFTFTGVISSVTYTPGTPDLYANIVHSQTARKQVDTVTLNTGTGGTANILCDAITRLTTFFNSYTETAAAFVAMWYDDYYQGGADTGVTISSSGADIILTSNTAGYAFSGSTSIANVANLFTGRIKMANNNIYEDTIDNDTYGHILINYKGYQGGVTRYRNTTIGDGKGNAILQVGQGGVLISRLTTNGDVILSLPSSDPHVNGQLWRSGTSLYISSG